MQRTGWKEFMFSAEGRISRKEFWLRWAVPYTVSYIILMITERVFGIGYKMTDPNTGQDVIFGYLSMAFAITCFWPSIAISLKRLHDRNRSGWFYLVLCVPVLGIWPVVEIMFLKGTDGPNRFGEDPVE